MFQIIPATATYTKYLILSLNNRLESLRPETGKEAASLDGKTLDGDGVGDLASGGMEIDGR